MSMPSLAETAAPPSRAEAEDLLRRALARASAEHVEVSLDARAHGSTRFSANTITQNISGSDATLSVRAAFGQQVGRAETNDLSDEGIARAVASAEETARASAPDLEYLPPLSAQSYERVEAWDEATAEAGPEARADWVLSAAAAAPSGVTLSGSTATVACAAAVANSRGLLAYHRSTSARFTVTGIAQDSSGWAEGQAFRADSLDPAALARRASEKALRAASPRALDPGVYTVVLEPAAVAEYLSFLAWSLGAKEADEDRSCLSDRLGTRIASEKVTLASDPARHGCEALPFSMTDGLPAKRVRWIEGGVLSSLATSRFWAQKSGKPLTGRPANLILQGGGAALDSLVAGVARGVLVTRFWYIRFVDPMALLLTGMTRDGLFLIENGKVTSGLRNMRFNDSPLRTLSHVEALGEPELTGEYLPAFVPPLVAGRFTFSSGTTF